MRCFFLFENYVNMSYPDHRITVLEIGYSLWIIFLQISIFLPKWCLRLSESRRINIYKIETKFTGSYFVKQRFKTYSSPVTIILGCWSKLGDRKWIHAYIGKTVAYLVPKCRGTPILQICTQYNGLLYVDFMHWTLTGHRGQCVLLRKLREDSLDSGDKICASFSHK